MRGCFRRRKRIPLTEGEWVAGHNAEDVFGALSQLQDNFHVDFRMEVKPPKQELASGRGFQSWSAGGFWKGGLLSCSALCRISASLASRHASRTRWTSSRAASNSGVLRLTGGSEESGSLLQLVCGILQSVHKSTARFTEVVHDCTA
jgi:hypothetical protein